MKFYQVIEIMNEEPLKIGAGGNKESTTEPSKDYIPGSTIRGATIGQMLRFGVCDNATIAPILKHMTCYNAYSYKENSLYIPTPQHLRINKQAWREFKASKCENGEGTPLSDLLKKSNAEDKNTLEFRFVAIKETSLQGVKIPKAYTLHHSKSLNKELKEKENLFSYQAILPRQTFRTIIAYDESIKKQMENVLSKINRLYLGGSKGTGYGLSRLNKIGQAVTEYNEAKRALGLVHTTESDEGSQQLVITCLSDCLFRDEEYGQPVNYIPITQLKKLCGLPDDVIVSLDKQFIQSGISEGYNAKWQARYPKETTLKASSVLVYKMGSLGSITMEEVVTRLERQLAGFRTQDGLGWLGVNINYPLKLQSPDKSWHIKEADSIQTTVGDSDSLQKNSRFANGYDSNADEVMSIILQGLQDTHKRWLQVIVDRSLAASDTEQKAIIIEKLRTHHLTRLRAIIIQWMNTPDTRISEQLIGRSYEQNQEVCSIAGCNFRTIVRFLESKGTAEEWKSLETYAEDKLNSRSGKLYYNEPANRNNQKKFIAELLSEGLYIRARRG